jgi:hypothetical protein
MQQHNAELGREYYVKHLVKPNEKFEKYAEKTGGAMLGQVSVSHSKKSPTAKFWMDKIQGAKLVVSDENGSIPYNLNKRSIAEIKQHCKNERNILLNSNNSFELSPFNMTCNEVIAGEFALLVLGKGDAPVTALKVTDAHSDNPNRVISRMKYPDCVDLFSFFVKDGKTINQNLINKELQKQPLTGFGENLALKILMQDVDIKIDSFVTYYSANNPGMIYPSTGKNNIYSIDWEQSFFAKRQRIFSILENPECMVSQYVTLMLTHSHLLKQQKPLLNKLI